MNQSSTCALSVILAALFLITAGAQAAGTVIPPAWKNCTRVNKTYPHGIGKVGARDHTSGTPVTNFKRSNSLYRTAMNYNRGLDRDKDGIACESA